MYFRNNIYFPILIKTRGRNKGDTGKVFQTYYPKLRGVTGHFFFFWGGVGMGMAIRVGLMHVCLHPPQGRWYNLMPGKLNHKKGKEILFDYGTRQYL